MNSSYSLFSSKFINVLTTGKYDSVENDPNNAVRLTKNVPQLLLTNDIMRETYASTRNFKLNAYH